VLDILISGGLVVGDGYERVLDVGIAGETIAFVGDGDAATEARRSIDATGKIVMPGGVEAHAHIHEPMHRGWTGGREVWLQSPEGATRAALHGGRRRSARLRS
jgi:dihydropyrimidinase